jgi:hypothetical protein
MNVNIDIDELLFSMSKWERKELLEGLKEDGYIADSCIITKEGCVESRSGLAHEGDQVNEALSKLWNNGWKLTKEEEETIINISKRFI